MDILGVPLARVRTSNFNEGLQSDRLGRFRYSGPLIRRCSIRGLNSQVGSGSGAQHRRGRITFTVGTKRYSLDMDAYHSHVIPDGVYDLVGSRCRRHSVLGKEVKFDMWSRRFKKISVLSLSQTEHTKHKELDSVPVQEIILL